MFSPKRIFDTIKDQGISFFTGVPDSLLKDFCAYVTDHVEERVHVIAANEGNAIALAAGWFMASGESALVYAKLRTGQCYQSPDITCRSRGL